MSIDSDKLSQNDAVAPTCEDGALHKPTVLETLLAKLKADHVVTEYATNSDAYKLVSYLWSKEGSDVLPFGTMKQNVFDQMARYKSIHMKSVIKALEASKKADEFFSNADFEAAIQHYGEVSAHCTNQFFIIISS